MLKIVLHLFIELQANIKQNDKSTIVKTVPIMIEQVTIGNNTVSLRELACGAYIISVEGELKSGKINHRLDQARNEFHYMVHKVTAYVMGAQHYE